MPLNVTCTAQGQDSGERVGVRPFPERRLVVSLQAPRTATYPASVTVAGEGCFASRGPPPPIEVGMVAAHE